MKIGWLMSKKNNSVENEVQGRCEVNTSCTVSCGSIYISKYSSSWSLSTGLGREKVTSQKLREIADEMDRLDKKLAETT